jgi:tetratricopeptide (TPR) repeat protein
LNDHPNSADLRAFLDADLPADKAAAVLSHLMHGCARCQSEIAASSPLLFDEELPLGAEIELTPELDAAYDAALDRAFAAALAVARHERTTREEATLVLLRQGPEALIEQLPRVGSLAACEALLERCHALRHEDPAQMVRLARLATDVAAGMEMEEEVPVDLASDMQARAWGELGNAYRVSEDLVSSEKALTRAFELYEDGTGDSILAARLFDLQASLLVAQRRFEGALSLLDTVYHIHQQHGDRHSAGRTLISKGLYTGYSGQPEAAIRLLREGLGLIVADKEPILVLSALHNMISFLVDCGRYEEAHALLLENGWRYEQDGARLNQVRHVWLGGLIQAGLGDLTAAERALLEARSGFQEVGLAYHTSITALDLGTVWLRQGRATEARQLVEEAVEYFQVVGISREALGALLLLRKAFEMERATASLVQSVADYLRRLEHNPAARFDLRRS